MAHPELYLNLNYNQKIIFSIAVIMIVLTFLIITKIKNNTKKCKIQQINRQTNKNNFKIDYDEFIRANFDKITYLYENKNRKAELIKMFS